MECTLVAVGCSWGGLGAMRRLLGRLTPDFAPAIVLAQHRGVGSPGSLLVDLLRRSSPLPVSEAEDKAPISGGHVYVAPADYHLLVEPDGFALSIDARVQYSRPSIDVLFESAADVFGSRAVGVILTGANADGAAGIQAVKRRGGTTLAQDPATAERATMPRAAIATGMVDTVDSLEGIGDRLVELCSLTLPPSRPPLPRPAL